MSSQKRKLDLTPDQFDQLVQTQLTLASPHVLICRVKPKNAAGTVLELHYMGRDDLCEACQAKQIEPETAVIYALERPPSDKALDFLLSHEIGLPGRKQEETPDRNITLIIAVPDDETRALIEAQNLCKPTSKPRTGATTSPTPSRSPSTRRKRGSAPSSAE